MKLMELALESVVPNGPKDLFDRNLSPSLFLLSDYNLVMWLEETPFNGNELNGAS